MKKPTSGYTFQGGHRISVVLWATALVAGALSCNGSRGADRTVPDAEDTPVAINVEFNADSAYENVARQVAFGPRVPGTQSHRDCGDWLVEQLKRSGGEVIEQKTTVTAFDGTRLPMRNIFAQFNPKAERRLLLLAHWDSRPWADADPDPAKHRQPVDAANDGASGVGVLLEIARLMGQTPPATGVDILFVDAEDWGTEGDDDSWALGARYFAENPPVAGYAPEEAILLDMVGDPDALFCREYFSEQAAPGLAARIRNAAGAEGVSARFPDRMGSAVTDDHVKLIEIMGIPAVDIIDYRPDEQGFVSTWHTTSDTMNHISRQTLSDVGRVVTRIVYTR